MTMLWIARMVRWDIQWPLIMLSAMQENPSLMAYRGIIHLVNYLLTTKGLVRIMSPKKLNPNPVNGDHVVKVYADTDADVGGCVRTGRSFMCAIV